MTKFLEVAQCLKMIDSTNKALKSYMDHFDLMEVSISRVLELKGSLKGKGGEALLRNYQELQLPAIRAGRAFIFSMMKKGEKLRSLILSFEPSKDGMVSEDYYGNLVPRGYDRFERFMDQNKAEIDALAASVSHIIDLGKLDIRHVQNRIDDARRHANDTVEGLYEVDHEGMWLMKELQADMVELKAILKQVTEWTVSGGPLLNGVDMGEVRSHFADKTLHTNAPEVERKLPAFHLDINRYAYDFPLSFKYYTMHSIMKPINLSNYQQLFSNMLRALPLTTFYNVLRVSTVKSSEQKSSRSYHPSPPAREQSIWAHANAHYSGDKETVQRAAEAIREIREKENAEPFNPLQLVSFLLDFVPYLGNIKAGQEASTAVDWVTGHELDEVDRAIAGSSLFLGGIGRVGGRIVKGIGKEADNIAGATRISKRVEYGDHYTRVNRKKVLKQNVEYVTPTDYLYKTDAHGRITHVKGDLSLGDAKRNQYAQRNVAKEDRKPNDDGGHLIASIFKGSGDLDNLVPMNANLNRGAYKKLENEWKRALEKVPPEQVQVKVQPIYRGNSQRPVMFEVQYKIGEKNWEKKRLFNN